MRRSPWWLRLAVILAAAPLFAQESPVRIHGFGGWAYGKTTDNIYLAGTPDGNYDRSDASLHDEPEE